MPPLGGQPLDKPKSILPTGTNGRSWRGELSYLPQHGEVDSTSLVKFDKINAKCLDSSRNFDLEARSHKSPNRIRIPQNVQPNIDATLLRTEKDIRKDKESFRTTLVNIVMQSIQSTNELHDEMNMSLRDIMDGMAKGDAYDKDKMQRYYYYITNGVDTQHVAEMEGEWLSNVLRLIPPRLRFLQPSIMQLSLEMREDYHMSVKKAIVDFVLKDPRQKNEYENDKDDRPEDFLNIRLSTETWKTAFISAKDAIRSSLFATNSSVLEILKVWGRFKDMRLIEMQPLLTKGSAFELRAFKSAILQRLDKAHEKLLTTWYPAILNVFYQERRRNEWSSIPNDRMESFFRTISLILGDQLRHIVCETLRDLVCLFDANAISRISSGIPDAKPITISIRLCLEDTKIKFDPPLSEIHSVVESLIDSILIVADRIPNVETQLFSGNQTVTSGSRVGMNPVKPEQCIRVAVEATFPEEIKDIRIALRSNINKLLSAPNMYLNEFDKHTALIVKASDIDVAEFLLKDIPQEKIMECGDFIHDLANRARGHANKILEKMSLEYRNTNTELITAFEEMSKKLTTIPTNIEEMVSLQKYLDTSRTTSMKALEDAVDEAKKKLNFMITYFELKGEDFETNTVLFTWPQKIGPIFAEGENNLIKSRGVNQEDLRSRREKLIAELDGYAKQIEEYHTYSEYSEINKYLKSAQKLLSRLDLVADRISGFNHEEELLGWEITKFSELSNVVDSLSPFLTLYQTSVDFQRFYHSWMTGPFLKLEPESIDNDVTTMWRNIYKLSLFFTPDSSPYLFSQITKEQIERFKMHLPLISTLCNPGLRERHWKDISHVIGFRFQPDETTSLSMVLERNLAQYMDALEQISAMATKEFSFENALRKMYSEWKDVELTTIDYKDTGTQILASVEDIQTLLDDQIVKTQTMRSSPFIKEFEEETRLWDEKLTLIQEILDEWLKVQTTWLYLEPIFSSEDIMRQMPSEAKRFISVNKTWKDTMLYCSRDRHVQVVCNMPDILQRLKDSNYELELIQKGLNQYLEIKRLYFPRFFFLSNDEMLEILSETRDPTRVQPHLKKCFEGVNGLAFESNQDISGMYSAQKEFIKFTSVVSTSDAAGAVEKWLLEVEKTMIASVRHVTAAAFENYKEIPREKWVIDWPGQVVLCASQIYWTKEVEFTILEGRAFSLKRLLETNTERLSKIVELVRGSLTRLTRTTLEALVVIDVHARDVVGQLNDSNVVSLNDFSWLSQLRYYYPDKETGVVVKMINSVQKYGYEYLGNTGRLVITPLTDRCYRTLFGALQLNLGGAPEGPAGTGKTESVKDLAKALAMFCVVYNCSDGLDYIAMGKFFKGLASAGAWACFDEFNRIDLEVLSVVAQQILTIQRAKAAKLETFVFEGTELNLNPASNVFITMNPGYAGRSELPDNLKALFRPVAMMVPDYTLIAEISLYSFGFVQARTLAVKITATYRLCSEQLSSQDHYDYGMRAVKSVLNATGALKLKFPNENESIIVLRSIIDVNLAKFLSQDIPLFKGIAADLFPGVTLPLPDYELLVKNIHINCEKLNLQCVKPFLEKILQIYEMLLVRHGFMLVGESFSGKTAAYRVLQGALSDISKTHPNQENKVLVQVLNPKSITMGQLYGQFDPVTHEWSDGVLALGFRTFASNESPDRKWIVFDGPVDAIWIENMNTVLDDNKKLCLNSGEIIQLSNTMSLIFEVQDLAAASPATVSRCGMIFMEPSRLGWRDTIVQSWLNGQELLDEEQKQLLCRIIDWIAPLCLKFIRQECIEISETSNTSLLASTLNILDSMFKERSVVQSSELTSRTIQGCCIFAIIWSIGASVNESGRHKFSEFLRTVLTAESDIKPPFDFDVDIVPPTEGLVYDYLFDTIDGSVWKPWLDTLPSNYIIPQKAKYDSIMVPTMDTARYSYLLRLLSENNKPVLFVGPTGTGKSMYIRDTMLYKMPKDMYLPIFINFSAQTSALQTQEIIESKLDKRRKGVFGPPLGKRYLILIDDLTMPARETYGAQPPIELLRQWFDHSGWYNLTDNSMQEIVDIQFIGAMGPPGGGRNAVTPRLLRHFNIVSIVQFDDQTLHKIFETILEWYFSSNSFAKVIYDMYKRVVTATNGIYRGVISNLLPTPRKSHYTFNLRDFARVIQGVLLSRPETVSEPSKMIRLWLHETFRVFHDRLIDDEDRTWFYNHATNIINQNFEIDFSTALKEYDSNCDGKVEEEDLRSLIFATYLSPQDSSGKAYNEITDLSKLTSFMDRSLSEYNQISKKPMDLVMFRFAIEHLSRITRVLQQPRGNILLVGVGGSGRQSLSRMAAYVSEYDLFQVEISKNYNVSNWQDDLKKVFKIAGGQGKPTIFLFTDTQIQHESFLEDINNILNSGEVPNLYASDEKQELFELIRADFKSSGKSFDGTQTYMFGVFVDRCRENLHVCLCMSPVGEAFRHRLRKFPSLVNCCTIDWFKDWPNDALEMVAEKFLQDVEMEDHVRKEVIHMCKYLHESTQRLSARFMTMLRRYNYVTPTSYLELIRAFKSLLGTKRTTVSNLKLRYVNGLEKLNFAQASVSKMQIDLGDLQPQLIKTKQDTDRIMVEIERESKEVHATKMVVQADEEVASQKAAEATAIKEDCEAQLAEAIPALESAIQALDTLKPADITVLKSMKSPPAGVRLVMEAVCVMKDVKPIKIPDPAGSGKKIEDFWGPSKTLMSDLKFLDNLKAYDKDNILPAVMKIIRSKYMENPEFDPEKIKMASSAAEGLCRWVRAMECYDRVAKVVGPKKQALFKAESELSETMKSLNEKRAVLKEVEDRMAKLEANFKAMLEKKAQLENQVESVSKQLIRAEKLIGSLGDERDRWTQCAEDLQAKFVSLTGDTLISSGIIAYLGAFTKFYRDESITEWSNLCKRKSIPCSEDIRLINVLGEPVKVRAWTLAGLPNDSFSIDNGIMISNSRRWPLMIDPQGQANRWIKSMEKSHSLQIVKLTDSDYIRTIENAVQFGTPVLLENVAEELDPVLEPLLLKQTFKQGGVMCIRLEGLEDQLLGIVIAKERPELEEMKLQLLLQSAENKKQLQEIEDKILEILSSSEGNILEDETGIQVLSSSKVLAKTISEKQAIADKTEIKIDEIRVGYTPIAVHSSVMFFCITDLSNIEPMYQYSLNWYISLFMGSIEKSEKSTNIIQRLEILQKHFTESLYQNICRSLFEKDKLVFSFLLTISILRAKNEIDPTEWRFLLTGVSGAVGSRIPNPDPAWITEKSWSDIGRLSNLASFSGLDKSFAEHIVEWRSLFESPDPQDFNLPGKWHLGITSFEKLLVLRCLRPDRMTIAISGFIAEKMGSLYIEPPPFDLKSSYSDSVPCAPLIFVLSPGADPMTGLLKFADDKKMGGSRLNVISLGQGQGPIAEKMINAAVNDGSWIVLQNCHLAISWMPRLERICEELSPENTHREFRLWLTSYPSEKFPVSLLQNGVKMTNEPPKGLRANLLKSYLSDPINDMVFYEGCKKQQAFEKMLFGLCFFHAVVQERRQFGPIGWNIPYEFNETDLRISARQLRNFLGEYNDIPYDAVTYLTGQCNYGGRVTDDKDRRTLMTLLSVVYNPSINLESQNYKFSASGIYCVPPSNTSYISVMEYIKSLPTEAKPEAFCLHDNADIAKNQLETDTLFKAIISTQGKMDVGGSKSGEQIVSEIASEMLSRLPEAFDLNKLAEKYPVAYTESMNTVLLQEAIRFKNLTEVVRESLINIQKALKGLIVMSADLEDVSNSIMLGSIPKLWSNRSYPSMKPLGSYYNDLLERLAFFRKWIDDGQPIVFWLSGFFFTQSFLTGCLQNYSRKHTIPIDLLAFEYIVQSTRTAGVRPEEGQHVSGVFLEGARWDINESTIVESHPRILYSPMPIIWLRPGERSKFNLENTYDCPVYKTSARRGTLSTTGHSTNYVMSMRIPTKVPEDIWILRGVAALLSLSD
ncbi:hypothetical protein BASA50_000909 [Batrachochytrium salamandrivorans]|uniref:EF-hand domain-containing protein n=1 Tax=Batrachochytrium salamandrivorans TaxID=1357716 RepID=A0ABQ8ESM9_9FUNG|nr:hypothetical protein BASA50_000909 [Batrachochytrium salamandrivorans]